MAHALMQVLWFLSTALQSLIVVLLVKNRSRAEFPFFFHYNIFQVLASVLLFFFYSSAYSAYFSGHRGFQANSYAAYFYGYWAASAISAGLGFIVIKEVFRNAFKPYEALRDLAGVMFQWTALVLLLVAVILAFLNGTSGETAIMNIILSFERSILVMQAGMLLFLMLFSSRLGLTWKHHGFGIALGFGIYALAQLTVNSVRAQLGPNFNSTYSLLQSCFYALAVVIWTLYLIWPEPARVTAEAAFAPKPVLDRWNEVLSGKRGADGPFMGSLEKIVDHVMESRQVN
jgi:hypothetical protein